MNTDPNDRYSTPAIALHWLLALLILGSLVMGTYMTGLALTPTRLKLYNWHKWAGIVILALSIARLAWRLARRPPAPVPMPAWQARVFAASHRALYVLFIAVPLAGWAYSSSAGFPVVVFGIWPLPDFVPVDRELAAALKPLHKLLAWSLAGLSALHVAAALKHQFVDRDHLLRRMMPGRR